MLYMIELPQKCQALGFEIRMKRIVRYMFKTKKDHFNKTIYPREYARIFSKSTSLIAEENKYTATS